MKEIMSLLCLIAIMSCDFTNQQNDNLSVIDVEYNPNEQSFSAGIIKLKLIDKKQLLYHSLQNKVLKQILYYAIPDKDRNNFIPIDYFEKKGDIIVIGSSTHYFKSPQHKKNLLSVNEVTDFLKTKPIGLVFSSDTLIIDYDH
ncbi:hypothetical protein KJK34_10095 [Flavobacterium sp. D11R37]|uniref:hypothetical protein n=1 Tax=Flavobacterium coralii TaxID=2838017 RepID=UPI001CA6B737|nr:hypothetical protein [Flavobacterium coralii]MBY8963102.1 hypothetical protein [Flavobacterium coralii]